MKPKIQDSRFKIQEKGFTLIEVLVSAAIIAVVSSVIFANVGPRRTDITRAAQQMVLDIRAAQNLSLAPSDEPICVYGARIESSTRYVVYRNTDPVCSTKGYNPSYYQVVGSPVVLSNVTLSPVGTDISFEAPEPITYINGATGGSVTIVLTDAQGNAKRVAVNRIGRVEVQ